MLQKTRVLLRALTVELLINDFFFYRLVEDIPEPENPLMETHQPKGTKFRWRIKVFFF